MKEYDTYQLTGIHWACKIPAHWKTVQGKNLAMLFSGKDIGEQVSADGIYTSCAAAVRHSRFETYPLR